jgi:hypothetical protein
MFDKDFSYNVFVPSLKEYVTFKPLLVNQFKDLINESYKLPFLNIGFNLSLNKIIKDNIVTDTVLTEFDKAVIALYIRKNDTLLETNIPPNIKIPSIKAPTLERENSYLNYAKSLLENNATTDELLVAEITKYIDSKIEFKDSIKQVAALPIEELANIVKNIDIIKADISKLYEQIPYNISMFIE